ncbi:hypothetical protein AVEN_272660-1 [Araneus ventricosus]|uniref:Uncharacterized protein n=1 Tax=Araneus ventricosus TaxID=182803 RepID=A0A4Y2NLF0_ARAVE|nr:hypothetical protein AVEN_272660-1 [Araneus ventricosus]
MALLVSSSEATDPIHHSALRIFALSLSALPQWRACTLFPTNYPPRGTPSSGDGHHDPEAPQCLASFRFFPPLQFIAFFLPLEGMRSLHEKQLPLCLLLASLMTANYSPRVGCRVATHCMGGTFRSLHQSAGIPVAWAGLLKGTLKGSPWAGAIGHCPWGDLYV